MSHSVRVNSPHTAVSLPDGHSYDGTVTVTLTDDEFGQIASHAFTSGVLTDLGAITAVGPVVVSGTPSSGDTVIDDTSTTGHWGPGGGGGGGGATVAIFNPVSGYVAGNSTIGEIVLDPAFLGSGDYGLYQAVTSPTGAPPGHGWVLMSFGIQSPYVWDSATTYIVGKAILTLDATSTIYYLWKCLVGNTNSAPSATNTNWQLIGQSPVTPLITVISGVTVSGTPTAGEVLKASNGTNASWGVGGLLSHPGDPSNTVGDVVSNLPSVTSGVSNNAYGINALQHITIGSTNVAFGNDSGKALVDGNGNTAIGDSALSSAVSTTYNTTLGRDSLFNLVSGDQNSSVGVGSGATVTTGDNNSFFGFNAGGRDTAASEDASTLSSATHAICIGVDSIAMFSQVCVIGGGNVSNPASRVSLCLGNRGDTGGGLGVFALADAVTVPSANSLQSGGFLYSEAGVLKWRGHTGTVTPIAPA